MRVSKHGSISEKTKRVVLEIEEKIGVEIYVRGTVYASQGIKENKFYLREKNGIQQFILCVKGEGKYILIPDRSLNEEEIEKIKSILVEEGYLKPEEEMREIIEEEEIVEKPAEEISEEQEQVKRKRVHRRLGITQKDREEFVREIIKEIAQEEGNVVRDLVNKVKRKFEEYTGISDYPYGLVWYTIRRLDDVRIEKINLRTFKVTFIEKEKELEVTEESKEILTIFRSLLEKIKQESFISILNILEVINNNFGEEDKRMIRALCTIILEKIK